MLIRRLGCTKVQMGIQTLDQEILDLNERGISIERIGRAFELLRIFGFKIHAHAMANLLGSTPERDKADYDRLVRSAPFQPDEIKLYPCALIDGSRLTERYELGLWRPYTEGELLDVLASDVAVTPPFCRISRMIRDFSSHDIVAGNKKPNLRQLVERSLRDMGSSDGVQEIDFERSERTTSIWATWSSMSSGTRRATRTNAFCSGSCPTTASPASCACLCRVPRMCSVSRMRRGARAFPSARARP